MNNLLIKWLILLVVFIGGVATATYGGKVSSLFGKTTEAKPCSDDHGRANFYASCQAAIMYTNMTGARYDPNTLCHCMIANFWIPADLGDCNFSKEKIYQLMNTDRFYTTCK